MMDDQLSVQYAIVDIQALELLIARLYGWTSVRCQLIKGTMRDVYEVWAQGQHAILYLYRHGTRSPTEIEAELSILVHLSLQGIIVPRPIYRSNGQLVIILAQPEGVRFAVMMSFINGHLLGRQPTPERAYHVGQLLAKVHTALRKLPETLDRPVLNLSAVMQAAVVDFAQAVPERTREIEELRRMQMHFQHAIAAFSRSDMSYGLIHGDVIPSNILSDGPQFALLDFDLCAYSWHAYDIASFLVEIVYWEMGIHVRQMFLQGYTASCSLTQHELQSLWALQGVRYLVTLGIPARHINTWGRGTLSVEMVEKQISLMKQLVTENVL